MANFRFVFSFCSCNSDVGMIGGRQTVSLGIGCSHHSVVLHELGHVVGFWHEQNRPDRDKFIKILWENIIPSEDFMNRHYDQGCRTVSTVPCRAAGVDMVWCRVMWCGVVWYGIGCDVV